jgi:hypothetical protein
MTQFKPTLILRRLQIEHGNTVVYDQEFHSGINVIRGENSSGKSTIVNAIFFALGGDLTRWSDAALRCSGVTAEISVNGMSATVSRPISSQPKQPMEIFGGTIEQAREAPKSEWLRYPYSRGVRESFSQALFRLLEIPEAANEESGNITMHQMLRLMYSDQLSPVEELFRHDPFDSANTRQSVGRLLCGAFDDELYTNELKIRDIGKQFDEKAAELRSILRVLGRTDHSLTVEWLKAERVRLNEDRSNILGDIDATQREAMAEPAQLTLDDQEKAYDALKKTQNNVTTQREARDRLALEVADSASFIESLERKLQALSDANLSAEAFGDVRFSHCPACHAPINVADDGSCHLCKEPFDSERSKHRLVAIVNDLSIQIRQSKAIQQERLAELEKAQKEIERLSREFKRQSSEFIQVRRNPTDSIQVKLNELQRRLGYIDRTIEELDYRGRLIEQIDALSKEKDAINDELGRLRTRNDVLRANQAARLSVAYETISEKTRWFVSNDLRREDAFENPKRVDFDFSNNRITVDGQEYFSASSRVILKNSFSAGLLFAATEHSYFRHFRFLAMDTMEDKGMEVIRSHNFQNLLQTLSSECPVDHQIIFATSMISPELDTEEYTVGEFSTRDNPTLKLAN